MKKREDFIGFDKHEYNPIIREKTQELLVEILKKTQPKNVLEIGTFLGYSAMVILETLKDSKLISVEKNAENYEDAKQNLQGYGDRLQLVCGDAFDFLQNYDGEKLDFIFLDGPKGQYIKYLPYLKNILKVGGVLFVDDVIYYGLVYSTGKIDHKHRTIVNNLRKFLDSIQNDEDFEVELYNFDDGVVVAHKIS